MPGAKSKNPRAGGDNEEAATETDQPSSNEPFVPEEDSNNPDIVNNDDPNERTKVDLANDTAGPNDNSGKGNNREADIVTDQEQKRDEHSNQNIAEILDNLDTAEQDQPSPVEPFLMEKVSN